MEFQRHSNVGRELLNLPKKERLVYLDYARIIVAFLVIYGHLYTPSPENYVRVFIYQFHMPFFFIVSGMLHKFNGNIQFAKYVKTILVPIIFYVFLFFIFSGFLYHKGFFGYKEAILENIVGENLLQTYVSYFSLSIKAMVKGTAMLNGPCWFLIALFYCKIFMDFSLKQKKIGFILFIVGFVATCYVKHKELFIGNFFMAMPFYYLGYSSRDRLKLFFGGYRKFVVIVGSFLLMFVVMRYNGTVSMWSIKFGNNPIYVSLPLFYLNGVLGSLAILAICFNVRKNYGCIVLGANSLISILGLQVVFIFFVDNTLGYNKSYFESFLISICVMLLCVGFHQIIVKFTPWLIGKKNGK